jgi:hypothetical protein
MMHCLSLFLTTLVLSKKSIQVAFSPHSFQHEKFAQNGRRYLNGSATLSSESTTPDSSATQTTSVPSLEFEPISYGPPTTEPTHSSIPSYTGSGSLLQGYCTIPNYIQLDGPTAYWAPMVGCNTDKVDCCPYPVAKPTGTAAATEITVTVMYTVTVDGGPASVTQSTYTDLNAYPVAVSQASLQHCPDDYQTVSAGCCPKWVHICSFYGRSILTGVLLQRLPTLECYSRRPSALLQLAKRYPFPTTRANILYLQFKKAYVRSCKCGFCSSISITDRPRPCYRR